ncbi:putative membrane protein [Labrenzia sp. EL_126]|nr:putative membrane protein [Labrenzia sp. EL_126]
MNWFARKSIEIGDGLNEIVRFDKDLALALLLQFIGILVLFTCAIIFVFGVTMWLFGGSEFRLFELLVAAVLGANLMATGKLMLKYDDHYNRFHKTDLERDIENHRKENTKFKNTAPRAIFTVVGFILGCFLWVAAFAVVVYIALVAWYFIKSWF